MLSEQYKSDLAFLASLCRELERLPWKRGSRRSDLEDECDEPDELDVRERDE